MAFRSLSAVALLSVVTTHVGPATLGSGVTPMSASFKKALELSRCWLRSANVSKFLMTTSSLSTTHCARSVSVLSGFCSSSDEQVDPAGLHRRRHVLHRLVGLSVRSDVVEGTGRLGEKRIGPLVAARRDDRYGCADCGEHDHARNDVTPSPGPGGCGRRRSLSTGHGRKIVALPGSLWVLGPGRASAGPRISSQKGRTDLFKLVEPDA